MKKLIPWLLLLVMSVAPALAQEEESEENPAFAWGFDRADVAAFWNWNKDVETSSDLMMGGTIPVVTYKEGLVDLNAGFIGDDQEPIAYTAGIDVDPIRLIDEVADVEWKMPEVIDIGLFYEIDLSDMDSEHMYGLKVGISIPL